MMSALHILKARGSNRHTGRSSGEPPIGRECFLLHLAAEACMKRWWWRIVLLGLCACDPNGNYVYRPEVNARARVAGHVAAYYPIPPESPRGDVRVASFGITSIEPNEGGGEA